MQEWINLLLTGLFNVSVATAAVIFIIKLLGDKLFSHLFAKSLEKTKSEYTQATNKLHEEFKLQNDARQRLRIETLNRISEIWSLAAEGYTLADNFEHGLNRSSDEKQRPYWGEMPDSMIDSCLRRMGFDSPEISSILLAKTNLKSGPSGEDIASAINKRIDELKPENEIRRMSQCTTKLRISAQRNRIFLGSEITDKFISLASSLYACQVTANSYHGDATLNFSKGSKIFEKEVCPKFQELEKIIDNEFGVWKQDTQID